MGSFHVILSGCSGGGKSTLLAELSRRGFVGVPEPGRKIVEEELRGDGTALPWIDLTAFAKRAIDIAGADKKRSADETGWVFFDRGLVDAAVALQQVTGRSIHEVLAFFERYHEKVFLVPPWPEIYVNDDERQHSLNEAISEYDRLTIAYQELDYETIIVPRISVEERADFVLRHLT
ncbi:AAA family ATPase [Erythrobacter sp. QSSC1-22B]|uniref:AAA family ATPase n=1 Tax=Erythrobacter sp. QSSC1-22B TaxID=1860125 RepID=UPI00082C77A7|nr:AAA family ATPase [Erythrobacter sp. QSSC1-22B]